MGVKHFVSPSVEEEEEVTFEQLLEPYQPLPILEVDDSEGLCIVWGNEAPDVSSLLKLGIFARVFGMP